MNRTDPDFLAWMSGIQARVEHALARFLPSPAVAPERLHQAMRYAVLEGGKRVRPLLSFAAAEASGAPADRVDAAACAVEVIHAYSLVHDDMPCMDDDVLRRGKPTVHVEYDEATALLVGDALQALAFQLISQPGLHDDPRIQVEMIHILSVACGSRGMAGGQAIDLDSTGKALTQAELEFMHIHKTGALIRAAVLLGAACGKALDAAAQAQLDLYARKVGLAFQVVDDILDGEASTATLGKTAGKDAKQGKATYVSLLGAARAKAFAEELRRDACAAAATFGERGRRLSQLADFIVLREF